MIISHKHRFIFLHCRKAAGSSVVVALSEHLGPRDIQLSGIKNALDAGQRPPLGMLLRGGFYSLNHGLWRAARGQRDLAKVLSKAVKRSYRAKLGRQPQHAYATEVRDAFPREWASYHKFCVVRNPYDKVVSDYYWISKPLASPPSFSQFLRMLEEGTTQPGAIPQRPDNWPIYTIDDEVVVDSVVRYENLIDGLDATLRRVGIDWNRELPSVKSGPRARASGAGQGFRSLYSSEDRERVRRLFAKEIEEFGFEF